MIAELQYSLPLTQHPPGLWEPIIFQPSFNVTKCMNNPNFNISQKINDNTYSYNWMVLYSQEIYRKNSNLLQQDIRMKYSNNNGNNWQQNDNIVCNFNESRNGMPGITQLKDGSLFVVFEGFLGKYGWSHFTVNSVRSLDCGLTWIQKQVLYAPTNENMNAGSPQTLALTHPWMLNPKNGTIFVTFMSDVPPSTDPMFFLKPKNIKNNIKNNNKNNHKKPIKWPNGAYIRVIKSLNTGENGSMIEWQNMNDVTYVSNVNSYWPGMFYVNQSIFIEYQLNSQCLINQNYL